MLFRQRFLDGIRQGRITLAFRRWRRPSVRSGGTLLTGIGQLTIGVSRVDPARISSDDARRAGFDSRRALLDELFDELSARADGDVYRIELGPVGPDPRVALREAPVDSKTLDDLRSRLERMDARSAAGPWTRTVLELIEDHPRVRAGDLAARIGQAKEPFKINVRKLKNLGLTESLETGYRLSPRGILFLEGLRSSRSISNRPGKGRR